MIYIPSDCYLNYRHNKLEIVYDFRSFFFFPEFIVQDKQDISLHQCKNYLYIIYDGFMQNNT